MDSRNGKLGKYNKPELDFYRRKRIFPQQKDDLESDKLEEVEQKFRWYQCHVKGISRL